MPGQHADRLQADRDCGLRVEWRVPDHGDIGAVLQMQAL